MQSSNTLYALILIACAAGYIWLYAGFTSDQSKQSSFDGCIIKHTTNIPCPSCGSTRAVVSLARGNFMEALKINPVGYIVAIIMFLAPLWILIDLMLHKKTLFRFYQKTELFMKQPRFAIPLISLVIINWIWNITKGL